MKLLNRMNGILIFSIAIFMIIVDYFIYDKNIELKRFLGYIIVVSILVIAIYIVKIFVLYPIINKRKKLWRDRWIRILIYLITSILTYIIVMTILSFTQLLDLDIMTYAFGSTASIIAIICIDIMQDIKLNRQVRKKQNPGQWLRGKEMMKFRLLSTLIGIILVSLVAYALFLFATIQPSSFSLEMEQKVLEGTNNLYYPENIQTVSYEDYFITSWLDEGELYYQKVDITSGLALDPIKIIGDIKKPKKVQFIDRNDQLFIYILDDSKVDAYILNIDTGNIQYINTVADSIENFEVLSEGIVLLNENNQLEVITHNAQRLYVDEAGVEQFVVYDNQGQNCISYRGEEDGESFLRVIEMVRNQVTLIYETDNYYIADQNLEATYINGDHIGFLVKKDNRNKNTSLLTFYISHDHGLNFDDYLISRAYESGNYLFESISENDYIFYEVIRGNIYVSKYTGEDVIASKILTNTNRYSKDISALKKDGDTYIQWSERGTQSKTLYYASTNDKIIEQSLILDKGDYRFITINTGILLLTTLIPSFILLLYVALIMLPLVVLLKLVLKEKFQTKAQRVSFLIGVIYILTIGSYLVYYLNVYYDMNILFNYLNKAVFVGINIVLLYVSYFLANLRQRGVKFHSSFEKLFTFISINFVTVCLFTIPYILLEKFGYNLF